MCGISQHRRSGLLLCIGTAGLMGGVFWALMVVLP